MMGSGLLDNGAVPAPADDKLRRDIVSAAHVSVFCERGSVQATFDRLKPFMLLDTQWHTLLFCQRLCFELCALSSH